jgi:hypothetical protein
MTKPRKYTIPKRPLSVALIATFFTSSFFCSVAFAEPQNTSDMPASPNGSTSVTITNGISAADGEWSVDVLRGGNSETASFNPAGPASAMDLMSRYETYIDVGADGNAFPLDRPLANPNPLILIAPNTVSSTGRFTGLNGPIDWAATIRIPPGTFRYELSISFTSAVAFGVVRVINYMDENIGSAGDDKLVLINSPSSPNFQLLAIDTAQDVNVGIIHTAGNQSALNANYVGWTAANFSTPPANLLDLITLISLSGAQYSISGVVNPQNFFTSSDPRFPFSTVYGPADLVHAFAFDLNPSATTATVSFGFNAINVQPDAILRNGFEAP